MSRLGTANQRVLFEAIRKGKCKTYTELRAVANALVDSERQTDMFPSDKPTQSEREAISSIERKIQRLVDALQEGFDGNEVVILRKVNPLKTRVVAEQLELIEQAVRRMRLALRAAEVAAGASQGS
jgi:hypothetical protein